MKPSFLAHPVRLFGNRAVVILCIIFFMVPFALRGARWALERVENNVKDWLPADFPETRDLEWFGEHFVGERFVLVTWPGCTKDDPRFKLLVRKLRGEVVTDNVEEYLDGNPEDPEELRQAQERLRARQMGDRLELIATGDYYENWGGRGEKWLQDAEGQWYFITPEGEFYRWGRNNLFASLWRLGQRKLTGGNRAVGELQATLGQPTTPAQANEFHSDPRKLTARFFETVTTGPELLEELASEDGPLWPRPGEVADEDRPAVARQKALERLTGTLFGPAVPAGFRWTPEQFLEVLPAERRAALPEDWQQAYEQFVSDLIDDEYGGDPTALLAASPAAHSRHWDQFFAKLSVAPPPRQTCAIVTLSEIGKQDLALVLGRDILGRPPGKLIDLATNECNIALSDLKMGGPPVDNVAIDEEGFITLVRLIGWSIVVGLTLSYLCFRSVQITVMVFFVGGISAVASLAIVWWSGRLPMLSSLSAVDAVLLSMPSLVYVLGLSGAVHIVNYYREAVERKGIEGAAERALRHGWGPCTLAAFTTALGLISLCSSNLLPIKKFGLFSAVGVMATLALLFVYLPCSLTVWPPGYRQRREGGNSELTGFARLIESFWVGVGRWVIKRYVLVAGVSLALMVVVGLGLGKINTSVQLLKLFDSHAKIIKDYGWLETHFGKLVPMELVVRVRPEMLKPTFTALESEDQTALREARFQLNFLERMQLTERVQHWVEAEFGEEGQGIVGRGLSAVTFAPELPPAESPGILNLRRAGFNTQLEESRDRILAADYLRVDRESKHRGSELWRISLRLGALNDVDYGQFVHRQKLVVEPVLTAYRYRERLLRKIDQLRDGQIVKAKVGFIGVGNPSRTEPERPAGGEPGSPTPNAAELTADDIDQTYIFTSTLYDLLKVAGCEDGWFPPEAAPFEGFFTSDQWAQMLAANDCFVLVRDHPDIDVEFIRQHAKLFVDARDHRFVLGGAMQTAAERDDPIQVVYTGVVPVVYKAQRTLLNSLINSIALAFVMIALVMMVLLRDWWSPVGITNSLNVSAGMLSMIPNVFPVVLIFGAMGHMGVLVDIGTMMCASVAMGVAVDDTIHYLTWFRKSVREGADRHTAIIDAYRRVATAMTQTTVIGGLGLAIFALSTFTPTQRFGVMMVTLLAAALVGDLVLLPAILASPLGRFFCPRPETANAPDSPGPREAAKPLAGNLLQAATPHSRAKAADGLSRRTDSPHR